MGTPKLTISCTLFPLHSPLNLCCKRQPSEKVQAETREAALRAEEETREVALQAAVHRSLETKNYEELNVDEVSNKLDGLSATELKKVREYEEHNKNRETLITEIDRRLSATA